MKLKNPKFSYKIQPLVARVDYIMPTSNAMPFGKILQSQGEKPNFRGDYVITSCMLEDNVWWEAHLARKGMLGNEK